VDGNYFYLILQIILQYSVDVPLGGTGVGLCTLKKDYEKPALTPVKARRIRTTTEDLMHKTPFPKPGFLCYNQLILKFLFF